MDPEYRRLLQATFEEYLDTLEDTDLVPSEPFLSFDFSFLQKKAWRLPLSEWLVEGDLRELTNRLNGWQSLLIRWNAWNRVVGGGDDEKSWTLRHELFESLAHDCLLRPSAVRDTFTSLATDTLHQVRMAEDRKIADQLDSDPRPPKLKTTFATRRQKENQLRNIASKWDLGPAFLNSLQAIDTDDYKRSTFNYRNLHSHTIGPSLGVGRVRPVRRLVDQAEELMPIGDHRYQMTKVPGKIQVSYGFGGPPPLDLEEARRQNLEQYYLARRCYEVYLALLKTSIASLPQRPDDA
jgi:hypothetical protein